MNIYSTDFSCNFAITNEPYCRYHAVRSQMLIFLTAVIRRHGSKIVESARNRGDGDCCVNGERLVQAEVSVLILIISGQ